MKYHLNLAPPLLFVVGMFLFPASQEIQLIHPHGNGIASSLSKITVQPNGAPASGKWIGGIQLQNQRVVAASLDVSADSTVFKLWLRDGQPKEYSLSFSQAPNGEIKLTNPGGLDECEGHISENELLGKCSIGSDNLQGNVQLVRTGSDDAATERYEKIWQQGFLGPESFHFLAVQAAVAGNVSRALQWLDRGRNAKTPMSDSLLFSGHSLDPVRRDPRFRTIYVDPVAAHPELSQATYTVAVDRGALGQMRDGKRLVADVYRPDAPGRFPVILIRTPYGRGPDIPPGGVDHFAARGYVVVIQSVRGTGGSEGSFQPWINERKDGYDSIEWVSRQPWSNGRLGMMGLSYLGQTQWAAAVEAHPALKCIIPEVSGTDHMLDTPYDHGILRLDLLPWALNMEPRAKGEFSRPVLNDNLLTSLPLASLDKVYVGRTLPAWQQILTADKHDNWAGGNFLSDLKNVKIPVLNISGWFDTEANSTETNYKAMRALGRTNQWLIYGPWTHVWNQSTKFKDQEFGPDAKIDFQTLAVRWFDQWLKQKKVGVEDIPKVQVFVSGENKWLDMDNWPGEKGKPFAMHLSSSGPECRETILTRTIAGACSSPKSYVYNPANVNPNGNGIIPDDSIILRMSPTATDQLVYESPPFETSTVLSGPGKLDLWFSTSAHDVDFFVLMFDRDPSGAARAISGPSKMAVRYLNGWNDARPLVPDKIYNAKIDLRPFAHSFGKGHRLGILIRSEWFPGYFRNLNTGEPIKDAVRMEIGTERIYQDEAHQSQLLLWVYN